jgi:single-strand DNA-binding protein
MNSVQLIGRLTTTPELKRTTNASLVNFTLAVSAYSKNDDGKKNVEFINCTAWNRIAELIEQYCKKGTLIAVQGYLKKEEWEFEGRKITMQKVIASRVEFLKNGKSDTEEEIELNEELHELEDELPF